MSQPPVDPLPTEPIGPDVLAEQAVAAFARRTWQWWLLRGVLVILFGLIVLVWPKTVIGAIVVIIGILWVIEGLVTLVSAMRSNGLPGRVWAILYGALSVIAGIYLIASPWRSAKVLVWAIGLFAIIGGVVTIIEAIQARAIPHWLWILAAGVWQLVLGIAVVSWPGITVLALAVLVGVWAVLFGAWLVWLGLRLRSVAGKADQLMG